MCALLQMRQYSCLRLVSGVASAWAPDRRKVSNCERACARAHHGSCTCMRVHLDHYELGVRTKER